VKRFAERQKRRQSFPGPHKILMMHNPAADGEKERNKNKRLAFAMQKIVSS
jgi:hypothetical protein